MRVVAWRDGAGRIRRVVRTLPGEGGARTAVLSYDEAGRLRTAQVEEPGSAGPAMRRIAFDEAGRAVTGDASAEQGAGAAAARSGHGSPGWLEADLPRDPEESIRAPSCP